MTVCLSSLPHLFSSDCQSYAAAAILIASGLITLIGKGLWSVFTEISKDNMFSLYFVDHEPSGSHELDRGDFHLIPLGRSEHWIKIVTSAGLNVTHFNVRFISEEESKYTVVPTPDWSSIIQILEVYLTGEDNIKAQGFTMINDSHGGITMTLNRAIPWGTGGALFLKLNVMAHKTWSGKISFRGYDNANNPRYGRTDVRVVSEGVEAQTYTLKITGQTPTTVHTVAHTIDTPYTHDATKFCPSNCAEPMSFI